jgi:hypothetical protein
MTLKGSEVTMESQGDMSLKGMNVKMESQANLDIKAGAMGSVEASAPLTLKGAMVNINP